MAHLAAARHPHRFLLWGDRTQQSSEEPISSAEEYRINEQIRGVSKVRLIVNGPNGENENRGVMTLREALNIAMDRNLDLVEVSPNADPPLVRVMDFSKFLYERSKREREARKAQKTIEVKEIQLRPKTNIHHLSFKLRSARRWLDDGMKVKVRVRFRGREITHSNLAREQLNQIAHELNDVAVVEQMPNMDGRTLLMVLGPMKDSAKDKEKKPETAVKGASDGQKPAAERRPQAVKPPLAASAPAPTAVEKPAAAVETSPVTPPPMPGTEPPNPAPTQGT